MSSPLLPPSLAQDARFQAFAALAESLLGQGLSSLPVLDPDRAPSAALPVLARQWHVEGLEGWGLASTDAERRALLSRALRVHMGRGTPAAIRAAVAATGWDIDLAENRPGFVYDGSVLFDGSQTYTNEPTWGVYSVLLSLSESRRYLAEDAALIRAALAAQVPARCVLDRVRARLAEVRDAVPDPAERFAFRVGVSPATDTVPSHLATVADSLEIRTEAAEVPLGYGASYGWSYGQ